MVWWRRASGRRRSWWASRQRPSFDFSWTELSRSAGSCRSASRIGVTLFLFPPLLKSRLLLGPRIVVGQFYSDLACVFSFELQLVPDVILSASRDDDVFQVHPNLSNKVVLLVLIEDRALELKVVW